MSLRPPSANSRSPSPGAGVSRASMGRPANLQPITPRGGGRPTSELLSSTGMGFQTPEADAIDQWLQNYETTLEEMAAASMDVNFKEELSAIEQWFRVLSEAERTAALYSLLQHSTQVQIRFFITVLQQMSRSDPMTALLSPSIGGSMQSQMEAKLASMGLKSPGLKSPSPASPVSRTFAQAQAQARDNSALLSPDAPLPSPGAGSDAAATLAHQRAKFKASNAAHRISAPGTLSHSGDKNIWSPPQLGQVAERGPSPTPSASDAPHSPSLASNNARPKSTDFTGVADSFRSVALSDGPGQDLLSPITSGNWASQVNTPLIPMFKNDTSTQQTNIDNASSKLQAWSTGKPNGAAATSPPAPAVSNNMARNAGAAPGRVVLDDPPKFKRNSGAAKAANHSPGQQQQPGGQARSAVGGTGGQGAGGARGPSSAWSAAGAGGPGGGNAPPGRSAMSASGRFGGDEMPMQFGMGLGNPAAMSGLGMPGLMGAPGMPGFNMNMLNMAAMGVNPQQLLAAQMAATSFAHPAMGFSANMHQSQQARSQAGGGARSVVSGRAPSARVSASGRESTRKGGDEEDVDPNVLKDVPAWLRSLRLHKYTPNFEGMHWRDMVVMDEAALEAKGVAALGARRKMLKTFEVVRAKMGI